MVWRGTGAHSKADGSHDVRAAQRLVLTQRVRSRESLLMAVAIADSFYPSGKLRGVLTRLSARRFWGGIYNLVQKGRG